MNKYLSLGFIVILTTVCIISLGEMFVEKESVYIIDYNDDSTSFVSLFVEENGTYVESLSNEFPVDKVFNGTKSYCVHGGDISFDDVLNKLNISTSGSDKCYIYFDEEVSNLYLYEMVISDNGGYEFIENKGVPSFSEVTNSNDGIYKGADSYGDTYYYRGGVDNNWVYFGGFYWRIVRVNGDNSVRLIYSGDSAPVLGETVVMTGNQTSIATTNFNTSSSTAEYAGYMYTIGEQRGLSSSSNVKNVIDAWYESNMLEYSSLIADNGFCYDRTSYVDNIKSELATGIGKVDQYFESYINLRINRTPSLICNNISDVYTVSSDNGNGALTYPAALLTASEASMAGLVYSSSLINNYLYTSTYYWLGNPDFYSVIYSYVSAIYSTGSLSYMNSGGSYNTRVVLSLKDDVLASGSGYYNDPYVVVMD